MLVITKLGSVYDQFSRSEAVDAMISSSDSGSSEKAAVYPLDVVTPLFTKFMKRV